VEVSEYFYGLPQRSLAHSLTVDDAEGRMNDLTAAMSLRHDGAWLLVVISAAYGIATLCLPALDLDCSKHQPALPWCDSLSP